MLLTLLNVYNRYVFFLACQLVLGHLSAQTSAVYQNPNKKLIIGRYLYVLEDRQNKLSAQQAASTQAFVKSKSDIPNLGISTYTYWVKFSIKNNTDTERLMIELAYPIADQVALYQIADDKQVHLLANMGDEQAYENRRFDHQNYLFEALIPTGNTSTYLMKVRAGEQLLLPISVGTFESVFSATLRLDMIWGIYFGIIIVMFFYNLFVYFSVKDKVYLYYVIYIVLVGLTQGSLPGYTFKFLWPNSPWMANESAIFFPAAVGIVLTLFLRTFMHTKDFTPTLHRGFTITNSLFVLCIGVGLVGSYNLGQQLIQVCAMLFSLYALFVALVISRKGFRPAKFFLLAWAIFLLGICIYIMKDFGLLPYNRFSNYTMTLGSAIEVVLLSFALADRINMLKREKEAILKEQTKTLKIAVDNATRKLKEAQAELVQQEKMNALVQVAAGVAHEINNSSAKTSGAYNMIKESTHYYRVYIDRAEQLIADTQGMAEAYEQLLAYKKEIDVDGIEGDIDRAIHNVNAGIEHTTKVIKQLKLFSRVDSEGYVSANFNSDLTAMIEVLRSQFSRVKIVTDFMPQLPYLLCNSKKINQAFYAVLINALDAIKAKQTTGPHEGLLQITTTVDEGRIKVTFSDNGIGMSEQVKAHACDPFYTTKGPQYQGLGLASVYGTMVEHGGHILIDTQQGEGTRVALLFPIRNEKG